MNQYIKLATEIVILATAIVGLYKVIKIKHKAIPQPPDSSKKKDSSTFSLVKGFFEIYGAMLVPIVFMIAFAFLMKVYSTVLSSGTTKPIIRPPLADVDKSKIPSEALSALYMLEAADLVESLNLRDELLKRTIRQSISLRAPEIALVAADRISNLSEKDKELLLIMRASMASGTKESAISAISAMSSIKNKTIAVKEFIEYLGQIQLKDKKAEPERK